MVIIVDKPFDVMHAAVIECLPGYMQRGHGWIDFVPNVVVPGAWVEFPMSQPELGNMGMVKLQKQDDRLTEITLTPPPLASDDEALDYAEQSNPNIAETTRRLKERLGEKPDAKIRGMLAIGLIEPEPVSLTQVGIAHRWGYGDSGFPSGASREAQKHIAEARKTLDRKREAHYHNVVEAFFNRLEHDFDPRPAGEGNSEAKVNNPREGKVYRDESGNPTMPPTDPTASRVDFCRYYYERDRLGDANGLHGEIAEALAMNVEAWRRYYSNWLKEMGWDPPKLKRKANRR